MRPALREQIEAVALKQGRSLTEEIELRLDISFGNDEGPNADGVMTNAKLARRCVSLAKKANAWASALLLFPEREAHPDTIIKFLSDMQHLLFVEQTVGLRARRRAFKLKKIAAQSHRGGEQNKKSRDEAS